MTHVEFDPDAIRKEAAQRIAEADVLPRNWLLMGALLGYISGAALGGGTSVAALVTTVVMAGMGFVVGRDHASRSRVEAHLALCQVATEANTRAWIAESRLTLRQMALSARAADLPAEASGTRKGAEETPRTSEASGVRSGLRRAPSSKPQPSTNAPGDPERPSWMADVEPVKSQLAETTFVVFKEVVREEPVAEAPVPAVEEAAVAAAAQAPEVEAPTEASHDGAVAAWFADEFGTPAEDPASA